MSWTMTRYLRETKGENACTVGKQRGPQGRLNLKKLKGRTQSPGLQEIRVYELS